MPKNTQSSVPSSHFQQKSTADYMQLPFWCGILPDKDAKALLNHKNEFLLRQLEDRNAVCITVARKKNKIIDVPVVKDNGYRLHSQPHLKKKLRELIEFYWCTKYAIRYQNKKLRLEVPIMRPKWMLCEANVKQGKTLGAGAYGIVVKAELYELGQRRAVAVKKLVGQVPDEELSNLWEEARIMKNMAHKNIITFYGIVNDCKPFYIVIELVNGGSVDKYLQKEGKNSDNKTRLRILIDGSKGMKYLHSQNPSFLHLDFAARNLLINWTSTLFKTRQNMVTKVADFGLSKRTTRAKIDSSQPTNIRWMDPHSFVTERVDKWTDIWAFAITMFELFVRPYQIPYHGWEAQKVFDEVIAPTRGQRKRLDRPSRMPIHVHEIMKSCMLLDEKREQRPTFVQLQGLLETAFKKLD